jgi:hypothetical protein
LDSDGFFQYSEQGPKKKGKIEEGKTKEGEEEGGPFQQQKGDFWL